MLPFSRLFAGLWLGALLVACTPVVQEAGENRGEPELGESYLQAGDGARLPLRLWPAEGEAKAILIAVHGFNDYSHAYSLPADWWQGQGITTIAYDQRGFGEAPNFGIWPGKELLISDLKTMVQEVRTRYPGTPVYLIGESMGGAVLITALTSDDFPEVDGVILSAPAVWGWQAMNPFYQAILWTAAHSVPYVTLTGEGTGIQASDNIEILKALGADPLFIKETRIDAIYGLVDIMDEAYDAAGKLGDVPILMLYGAHDQLVPEEPTGKIAAELPASAELVYYEDGWHMLMRDLQGPVVWKDIAGWILNRDIPSGKKVASLPRIKSED
tara:strand:+ start:1664 stop:2647 length:984 start_codon:yes stop_codon:yes gene_type:complete